ncbi:cell division protein SepF [Jeotgalibaca sp. MA1X17-3]|uniref:cell division protein SepF n=1 Tax=Jeotgalibaca sp. MA1X17-3 TaxID=2908211 RepID=UPI001F1AD1CB|nr:cell division protein SepF [Jeotgalibaca sp. MA1X17-3]UJF15121.1 cell division protein SepF [Jeotgalibaca sp. MA1X17-3]
MTLKDSMRSLFGMDVEDDEWKEMEVNTDNMYSQDLKETISREETRANSSQKSKANVIPMGQHNSVPKTNIHILEPRVYSESQKIADYLLKNETVLLNFKRMERDQAVKIIDYVMGCVYALHGDIQEVGDGIFLCTPATVEITSLNKDDYENFY